MMAPPSLFQDKPHIDKAKRLAARKAAALALERFQPEVIIEPAARLKSAKARLEPNPQPADGPWDQPLLIIQLPDNGVWQRQTVIQNLTQRVTRRHARHALLWHMYGKDQPRQTLVTDVALSHWVNQINAQTLNAPVKKAQLGRAVRSRAAQINSKNGVMTVARFVLTDIPEQALRYLIIHELCHLTHMNHSRAFWQLVGKYQPDYKIQDGVLDAHHYRLTLNLWP
jgi:predicted metal-dependent hydrolase